MSEKVYVVLCINTEEQLCKPTEAVFGCLEEIYWTKGNNHRMLYKNSS